MQSPGSSFLHERNPQFHASLEVEGVVEYLRAGGETTPGEVIPNDPAEKISAYLGFLANQEYVNDGILTGDQLSIDRQIAAHVIKVEDVPESYFELQRRIAREQGRGDLQITPEVRQEAQRIISADQRHSLRPWAEYLSSNDARYPDWFKQYAFAGALKMGKFDKQNEEFQKRSQFTTVPFPEISRGALSQVYTWLKAAKVDGKKVRDIFEDPKKEEAFQRALKTGNFPKLYVHAIHKTQEGMITPEQTKELKGRWKKYVQGSDPEQLHGDLQGFGLDWCTATGYETAATHIKDGDFYVYYTRDEDGKGTVPRVAIRMERGEVAEVRGVNPAQELEHEMADITAEQLKDLPGGEEYIRKAEDMKRLTAIEKRIVADPDAELTSDELRFLYELDHEIEGFGYQKDPRVKEIRAMRGDKDKPELARILPEAIREQVRSAYIAYKTVANKLFGKLGLLGMLRKREVAASMQELEQLFAAKDKEWQANGVYDYLVEKLIADEARFSLVATPNVEAGEAQVVALAEAFGKDQPHETRVNNDYDLYRSGYYTAQEWSGNKGAASIRLSLIPNRSDGEMGKGKLDAHVQQLRERRTKQPELDIRVPSVLEAITYWYSLRAQGDKLVGDSAYYKTFIHHFDLEPTTVDVWRFVPSSCVNDSGNLSFFVPENVIAVRLAVG